MSWNGQMKAQTLIKLRIELHNILKSYCHRDNSLCNMHIAKRYMNCIKRLAQKFTFMCFVTQMEA